MEALLKKQAARLRLCRFFIAVSISFRPFAVLDFEPCRIRKTFGFTHHGIRHTSKKVCESTLVSKLPRMSYSHSRTRHAEIRKVFDFTHYGCRHILKKEYESTLVSKLPRMDSYSFFTACLVEAKKMEVTGLEPVTLCL